MKNIFRTAHFWIILAIMFIGALVFYADRVPWLQNLLPETLFKLTRYSTYRILSVIPVAYAAFVFGWRGGLITAVFIGIAILPRAFFLSPSAEAITETAAFLFIALLVTWLTHRQQLAVKQLQKAKEELQSNVAVIQENAKKLNALYRIANAMSESLELGTVLSGAINNVADVMKADEAWIFLSDETAGELVLSAHRGTSEEITRSGDRLKLGEGVNGRVAQSGQPLYIENASLDPLLTREIASKFKLLSTLIVPISSKKKVNGTICIAMQSHRQFQPQEVELLTGMGYQIGVAIENSHLYRQQQTTAQQLRISEERYRGLFENSSDALFVCSTTAGIISVNHAGEELTGYTSKKLQSTAIYNLFTGEPGMKLKEMFSGNPEQIPVGSIGEARLIRKNGMEAYVELRVSPILRKDEVIGLQVIAQDVTEEKQLRQNMEYYIKQVTNAQEDERLRISRELHDDTAQLLATLSRGIDSLMTRDKELPKSIVDQMKKLHDMADSALDGVRRFSQDLRPSILDDLGLVPALEWLITDLERGHGMTTAVKITGNHRRLLPEIELTVFRIAQEVFSNIRRHSKARDVEMSLDFGADALTLVIIDNGEGFDIPQRTSDLALSGKLGIIGMRERARLIGGTLTVQSGKGAGTNVTLMIPA